MKKMVWGCLIVLLFTGCSPKDNQSAKENKTDTVTSAKKSSEFDSAMAKGKEALIDKDLSKAQAAFQLALEYKKDSSEATSFLKQIELYEAAATLKEKKEYVGAVEKIAELNEVKDLSTILKQYGQEMIKEIAEEKTAAVESKKAEQTTETKNVEKAAETTPVAPKAENNVPWNQQKRAELIQFMAQWGQTMDQNYVEYSPNVQVNWYGINFPNTFGSNNIAVNGSQAAVQWSDSGLTSNVYNVVAIYSDIGTSGATMNNHLYLFTIFNGQPIVLITQQNQGNAENLVYFTETQNADLSGGFAQIVNG
ncbi:DUF4767 domain-containing protein [Enterococcus termitis]|uniref:DUF4767 domain-containing protein n=1 Tax=Enterococcus termitis TaxID=332950 RepID=A0A1E5GB69_9ENTE|nr:DUF4767 domain-containing protein [Enterococcus termitis]OEG09835.1 hypothetical protein BCR25_10035 [Enterococcus termitis]OJG98339.1 hypothetical protein RV18_GL003240 [Enterococcus termitis]